MESLASVGCAECPEIALLVVAVERAGPAPPLGQSGGVDRRAVAEEGCELSYFEISRLLR